MSKFDQKQYINKFNKEKYDTLSVRLPKGYKEKFNQLAKKQGLSMAGYIKKLVEDNNN